MKQTIQMKLEQSDAFSQEWFVEIVQNPMPDVAELIQQVKNESLLTVYEDYCKAQEQGDIRPDIKPEFILYFLNHMIDMAADEKLIHLYGSPKALVAELVNLFFYGIVPRT